MPRSSSLCLYQIAKYYLECGHEPTHQAGTYLTVEELAQGYRQARDGTERSHWHTIWLLAQGHRAVKVAEMTGYSAYWIGHLARRYNAGGPAPCATTHIRRVIIVLMLLPDAEALAGLRAALHHQRQQGGHLEQPDGRRLVERPGRPSGERHDRLGRLPSSGGPRRLRPAMRQAATPEQQEGFKNW